MGRACDTYWEKEKCIQGFGRETGNERDYVEDLGVDDGIVLQCILNTLDGRV